jgi:flagellar hook-length control protein FliK
MPSATTYVSIGPPLDLIGPVAATPANDDEQTAFDSLLQSPPAPTTAGTSPAVTADENLPLAYDAENRVERRDSSASPQHVSPPHTSPPQSSAKGNTRDSSSDAPSQVPHDSTEKATPASAASSKPKTGSSKIEAPPNDQPPQAAEPVVAESLAGLAGVAPVAAAAATPAIAAEVHETKETEPAEPKSAGVKQAGAGPAGAIPTPAARPPANAANVKPSDADVKSVEKTLGPPPGRIAPNTIQVAAAAQPVTKSSTTEPAKGETAQNPSAPGAIQVSVPAQPAAKSSTTESAKLVPAATPNAPGAIQVAATVQPAVKSSATESVQPSSTESAKAESTPNPTASSAVQIVAAAEPAAKSSATGSTKSSTTKSASDEKTAADTAVNLPNENSLNAKSLSTKSLSAKPLDEQAGSSDETPQGAAEVTQETTAPTHKQHQALPNNNQPPPTLDFSSIASPPMDSGVGSAPSVPAPAAPVAVALPTLDPGPTPKPSSATDQVTNVASPPRPRLPAELLVQAPSGPSRRATVEIDTTLLLARVARAFTAAQERDGEIRLRLSPPELGSLRLDVRIQDGAMVARLQTETDAARTAIIDNLPALRDRLSEQGVRIERFDVDLMQRQPGGMPDQPGGRQQPDLPTARVSAIAPPRRASQAPISSGPTLPTIGSADGLNVVV